MYQDAKARLMKLIKEGWNVNTVSHTIPAKVKAAGFTSLYFITNGDELLGMFV